MQDLDEITRVKKAAEADLLKRSGVTAVDIGHKYVGGKKTGEIAIRVHVAEKKDVPADQEIPKDIDGIKTDVLQNKFVLHPLSVPMAGILSQVDAKAYDPLQGGISIGPCRIINGSIFAGTLGAIVLDNVLNTPMMLSNFHVMAVDDASQVGDPITQPSRVDGGLCPNEVAGLLRQSFLGGEVDCAVARITGHDFINEIVDIGPISGIADAVLGEAVRKRGRTTGLTFGFVDGINGTVTIDYGDGLGNQTLTNQITLVADPTHSTSFGNHGDSGSVVVNGDDEVIGLYFAGDETGTTGSANPIQSVLGTLNCRFPD